MVKKKLVLAILFAGLFSLMLISGCGANEEAPPEAEQTASECNSADTQTSQMLVFDYDQDEYELIKCENDICLTGKTDETRGFFAATYRYVPDKDSKTAADESAKKMNSYDYTASVETSDLEVSSVKVVSKQKNSDAVFESYFIDDGQGGIFELSINLQDEAEKEALLKSVRLLPKEGNADLMKYTIQEGIG